jgi:hypothetical protein
VLVLAGINLAAKHEHFVVSSGLYLFFHLLTAKNKYVLPHKTAHVAVSKFHFVHFFPVSTPSSITKAVLTRLSIKYTHGMDSIQ